MYEEGNEDIKEDSQMPGYKNKRRITRELFKTNSGKIINSDISGSLKILRKYKKEIFSPNLEIAMGKAKEQRPLKKRVV